MPAPQGAAGERRVAAIARPHALSAPKGRLEPRIGLSPLGGASLCLRHWRATVDRTRKPPRDVRKRTTVQSGALGDIRSREADAQALNRAAWGASVTRVLPHSPMTIKRARKPLQAPCRGFLLMAARFPWSAGQRRPAALEPGVRGTIIVVAFLEHVSPWPGMRSRRKKETRTCVCSKCCDSRVRQCFLHDVRAKRNTVT